MPAQTGKSGLVGKLGNVGRKAFDSHKNDETNFGFRGELPDGIENGIAQLVDVRFGQYKEGQMKGEYFFMAAGVVVLPKSINGIPIEGMRTQIGPEPLCETPTRTRKTTEEHLAWVLNEMRKLGLDTKEIDYEDLETAAANLKEAGPYFRFRTWKGEKATEGPYKGQEPRTNHQWSGAVDYNPEDDDEVVEETPPEEQPPAKAAAKASSSPSKASGGGGKGKTPPAEDVPFGDDLDMLGDKADAGDSDAAQELTERAEKAGIDTETVEGAESWTAVVELIRNAGDGEASGDEEPAEEGGDETPDYTALGTAADEGDDDAITALNDAAEAAGLDPNEYETWTALGEALADGGGEPEEEWTPKKEEVYLYKPTDPKTKKPARKAVECEVTMVIEKNKTVNLKNMDDGKTIYKAVKWDRLEQVE